MVRARFRRHKSNLLANFFIFQIFKKKPKATFTSLPKVGNVGEFKKKKKKLKIFALILIFTGILSISISLTTCENVCGEDLLYFFNLSSYKNFVIRPYIKGVATEDFKIKLKDKGFVIEKVLSESDSFVAFLLKDNLTVILSKDKSLDGQISSLQSIVTRLTISNSRPVKIDFRFAKPIVNFSDI